MNSQILQLEQKTIFYSIRYSQRSTLSIRISEEGALLVCAPRGMSAKEIDTFLKEKKEWILKYTQQAEERAQEAPLFEWRDGMQIKIAGQNFFLVIQQDSSVRKDLIQLVGETISMKTAEPSPENIRDNFTYWCKKACKPIIEERTKTYASRMGVSYERITLKEQKKCWGSCSNRKNLNFNWKLLIMPVDIMDYVIVHELAHLKQMNHSPAFWKEVAKEIPDFKKQRKWLKDNGFRFTNI